MTKSSFGFKIEVDLNLPNYSNADIPLGQIAKKIVAESRKNIRTQRNLDGSSYTGLSVKTIKDKRRQNSPYPRRALYRKGIMYRAIHPYRLGKNNFAVGIIPRGKPPRDFVGQIHQERAPVLRSFLGFNSRTEKWAEERILRWISEKSFKAKKVKHSFKN